MQKEQLASIVGWALCVLSVFLVVGTTIGRNGSGPMFPSLIPVFGVPFVIFFLLAQAGICYWLRSSLGIALVVAVCLLGYWIGGFGEAKWKRRHTRPVAMDRVLEQHGIPSSNYDWTRDRLIKGVSMSALVLGVICIRKWD
ncbi:hypothetical protein Mal52_28920 [Symmachiella dynata]|uniref:Uncharacterized protein n=1 Tax=Symmachiella dynata TaxID=2527995 RepID=A0A517ZPN1_9PLAN|nr:hypothetical protein [Symmachiella dynata]QDU44411.1 hypothetical protein Mal52_28920 [Symmachiella dynata]